MPALSAHVGAPTISSGQGMPSQLLHSPSGTSNASWLPQRFGKDISPEMLPASGSCIRSSIRCPWRAVGIAISSVLAGYDPVGNSALHLGVNVMLVQFSYWETQKTSTLTCSLEIGGLVGLDLKVHSAVFMSICGATYALAEWSILSILSN